MKEGPRTPSLREVAAADAVFILGEDVTNTAPLLGLSLRQSVRQKPIGKAKEISVPLWNDAAVRGVVQDEKGPLFIAATHATRLDEIATGTYAGPPDHLARLGFAIAHALDPAAPAVPDADEEVISLARTIADSLKAADRPVVISGVSTGSEAVLRAAANVAGALCRSNPATGLGLVMRECNSLGSGLMSAGSGEEARGVEKAFAMVEEGKADTVIILENDLFRRADDERVTNFLDRCEHVIVLDHLLTRTAGKAEVVLPAATFAESEGTLVNNEGRAQRSFRVFVAEGEVRESWRWLRDVMLGSRRFAPWPTFDDVVSAMADELPVFRPAAEIAPPPGFRIAGQKIPRQPHRYSGRTAMHAGESVHEPQPPDDPDSALSFSMEGYEGMAPPPLISRFWAPGWNSVQALNKFQNEVGGPLRGGDPGRRLLEPPVNGGMPYFAVDCGKVQASADELLVVVFHHIFGSDELSLLSPGIAGRVPERYLAVNPEDAGRFRIEAGTEVEIMIFGKAYRLRAVINASLPPGVAGLPVVSGLEGIALPACGKVGRVR